mmetsp:Transcript_35716/g.58184  ORF Transcript_35716/g.58184 Transcript_35716/m.58184 type:complete len:178 (-) Transcript_35716:298-831(-)
MLLHTQVTELKEGFGVLDNMANDMYLDFNVVRGLTDCSKVNPVYTRFVHDAVCINGVGGLTWVFASMLLIAIMAMFMLTFRAAIRPVKEIPTDDLGGGARSDERSDIISRDVTTRVLEDGTRQIIEVLKIRNADGTITEEITTWTEEATTAPLATSHMPPPTTNTFSYDEDIHNMEE